MLLAPADARAHRIELQVQFPGNLLIFQFFDHVFDHHVFIEGRQLFYVAHQAGMHLVVDNLVFRRIVRELRLAVRRFGGGLVQDAFLFLVFPLDQSLRSKVYN